MCFDTELPAVLRAPPLIARALSRSMLRDANRRLVAIRLACGFHDKEQQGGEAGSPTDDKDVDPFIALVRSFELHIEQARAAAAESINDLRDRAQIHKDMDGARQDLEELRRIVDTTNAELNTAELKQKAPDKVYGLRDAFESYRATLERCESCYDEARKATEKLTWGAASQLGQSVAYKRAVRLLAERSGVAGAIDAADNKQRRGGGDDDGDDDGADARDLATITLEQDAETQEQMRLINRQKAEVRVALDRIFHSVQAVHGMAVTLRNETTLQVARMDELDERMRLQVENIRNGTQRIEKLMASMQPFNVCVNCTMLIIVLAAAGFLLWRLCGATCTGV